MVSINVQVPTSLAGFSNCIAGLNFLFDQPQLIKATFPFADLSICQLVHVPTSGFLQKLCRKVYKNKSEKREVISQYVLAFLERNVAHLALVPASVEFLDKLRCYSVKHAHLSKRVAILIKAQMQGLRESAAHQEKVTLFIKKHLHACRFYVKASHSYAWQEKEKLLSTTRVYCNTQRELVKAKVATALSTMRGESYEELCQLVPTDMHLLYRTPQGLQVELPIHKAALLLKWKLLKDAFSNSQEKENFNKLELPFPVDGELIRLLVQCSYTGAFSRADLPSDLSSQEAAKKIFDLSLLAEWVGNQQLVQLCQQAIDQLIANEPAIVIPLLLRFWNSASWVRDYLLFKFFAYTTWASLPCSQQIKELFKLIKEAYKAMPDKPCYQCAEAIRLNYGIGCEKDLMKALALFQRAAEANYPPAAHRYALLSKKIYFIAVIKESVLSYLLEAHSSHYVPAQVTLGSLYEEGRFVAKDLTMAFSHYYAAAQQADPAGLFHLGLMYEKGCLIEKNLSLAYSHYKSAADLGSPEATEALQRLNSLRFRVGTINVVNISQTYSESQK